MVRMENMAYVISVAMGDRTGATHWKRCWAMG